MKAPIAILLLFIGTISCSIAQNLKRRAFLGVQIQAVTDSVATANKLPAAAGAQVVQIIPNSTAATLKLKPNDIIQQVNSKPMQGVQDVLTTARNLKTGDEVVLSLVRNGKKVTARGKVEPMPKETAANAEVIYDEVSLDNGGFARAIIKKPKGNGKFPAFYFIQGFSCASIDNLPENDMQRQLMDGLLAKGYAVFKMEKPGVGDSQGTEPCQEIGYTEEVAAFAAGLKKLKQYNFVDTENIFLFGHSLGGNTAPLIAANDKVKGIITYGAVGKPWFEYMVELYREQRPVSGIDYVQVDEDMKTLIPLVYDLMVQKKTPEQLYENAAYRPYLEENLGYDRKDHLFGRHYTFLQELQDQAMNKAWKEAAAYTLAIYGEADVQALDAEGARIVADVVNYYHPGKGSFEILPKTDHGFVVVGTKQDYVRLNESGQYNTFAPKHFNHQLVELLHTWMQDKQKKA